MAIPAANPTPHPSMDILTEEKVPSWAPDPVLQMSAVCSGISFISLLSALENNGDEPQAIKTHRASVIVFFMLDT